MIEALPVASTPAPELPEALVLDGAFDAFCSELWRAGRDHAAVAGIDAGRADARAASRRSRPRSLRRARRQDDAPGRADGRRRARWSRSRFTPGRARALARTCEQMGADSVRVLLRGRAGASTRRQFDRVLVDPPCSGLGTLQSRPDLRWQPRRGQLATLAVQAGAAAAGRPPTRSRRAARSSTRSARSAGSRATRSSTSSWRAIRGSSASSAGSCCRAGTVPTASSSLAAGSRRLVRVRADNRG